MFTPDLDRHSPAHRKAENAEYKKIISTMCSIPLAEIDEQELKDGFRSAYLLGQEEEYKQKAEAISAKYFRNIDTKLQRLHASYAIGALTDDTPGPLTYGTGALFYLKALNRYSAMHPQQNTHKALLAGAFTRVSMKEFDAVVRKIFPSAECVVVDPEPSDKPAISSPACRYEPHDARDLPYRHQFDSIHTSGLLDYLGGTQQHRGDSPHMQEQRRKFFDSSLQALRPNGILVLGERQTDYHRPFEEQPYIRELHEAGFRRVEHTPVYPFLTRRFLDRFLFGTSRKIDIDQVFLQPVLVGVVATA